MSAPQRPGGRLAKRLALALRDERGFTLIELLVATVAGIIVTAAMGAIVITTVHFNSDFTDRVDANQEGRTAMGKIVQALDSSCVASGVAPIISGSTTGPTGALASSDSSHIWFYSAVAPGVAGAGVGATDSPTINPALVEIYLSGNQLWETAYPWSGGTAPEPTNANPWSFNWSSPTSLELLPSANAPVGSTGATGTTGPIFSYYGYTTGVTGATGTISSVAFPTPLSTTNAQDTAQVVINYRTLATDNWNAGGRASDISDAVVLRLTPASSDSVATNAPCS